MMSDANPHSRARLGRDLQRQRRAAAGSSCRCSQATAILECDARTLACRHLGPPTLQQASRTPIVVAHRAAGSRREGQRHLAGRARHPVAAEERADRQLPGPHGQRRVSRCSRATASSTTTSSARTRAAFATTSEVIARRGEGARGVDDVEVRAARHPVRRRQGRHQVRPAPALARPSSSASRAASRTRSAPTSAPSTTSRRPTWAPTARSWSG